jgi:hypothetical protein
MFTKTDKRVAAVWELLVEAAQRREALTYGQVADKVGGIAQGVSPMLKIIEQYCQMFDLPLLSALVVRRDGKAPGSGFAPGTDYKQEQQRCFEHDWKRVENPFA